MSPFFNTLTGEFSTLADDSDVTDRDGIAPSALTPDAPTPAARTPPSDAPMTSGLTRGQAQLRADAIRNAADTDPLHPLRDERHPAHEETVKQYLEWNRIAAGDRVHSDIEILGDEPARGREPSEQPPIQPPALSVTAREAGFAWNARRVEALTTLADQSGLPRYHLDLFLQDVAAASEAEAAADEESTRDSARADLIRREGPEGAQQTIRDAQELVNHLAASDNAALRGASEAIVALSRNPQVVIGAARLYRELSNLDNPQGAWAELLLGRGARWAEEQAAGKARAAAARQQEQTEANEARAGFMTETAERHARWGKVERGL